MLSAGIEDPEIAGRLYLTGTGGCVPKLTQRRNTVTIGCWVVSKDYLSKAINFMDSK